MPNKEPDFKGLKPKMSLSSHNLARDAVDLAYKLGSSSKYSAASLKLHTTKLLQTGWEVLCTSADSLETNQYGYKSVAFINRETKEVHIATAGTKSNQKYNILDDVRITFGFTPSKMAALKSFVDDVVSLGKFDDELDEYSFSTSGHSLGAVLSDLTAVELMSRGLTFEESATFDTPGSKTVVMNAIKSQLFTGKVTQDIVDKLPDSCVEYNARPNFINTINEHLASTIHVITPEVVVPITVKQEEAQPSGLWGGGQYLYNKVGTTVSQCSEYLGVKNVVSQLESHKLSQFECIYGENAPITKVEAWGNKVGEQLVLKTEELAKLTKTTATGKEVVAFTDEIVDEDSLSLNCYEFGYSDLSRCHKNSEIVGVTEDYEVIY